jgi:hypothetical protein
MITSAEELLRLLNKDSASGVIVSTSKLDAIQIAQARACNRMFVTEDGLGFVYLPNMIPVLSPLHEPMIKKGYHE